MRQRFAAFCAAMLSRRERRLSTIAHRKRCSLTARHLTIIGICFLAGGCATIAGGPGRLYTIDEEVAFAQKDLPGLAQRYIDAAAGSEDQKQWRNEYIARRMYIIDAEYSAYEAALTSDRQKFMFASATAGQVTGTLATLVAPGTTARALTGAATALSATQGFYDSDLVIAKTIQIVEAQMRAQRNTQAKHILEQMDKSTTIYPLSAALSDLEQLYLAGTLNSGLIKAAGDAGSDAQLTAKLKNATFTGTFGPDDTSDIIQNFIAPGGKVNTANVRLLNQLLDELGYNFDVRTIVDATEAHSIRQALIDYASKRGINLVK